MSRSRLFLNGRSPSFTNYKQIITHVKQIVLIIIHFGKKMSNLMQLLLFILVMGGLEVDDCNNFLESCRMVCCWKAFEGIQGLH